MSVAEQFSMNQWFLYLIRCADGKLYTGISTDVEHRFQQHETGEGAKFTRGRGPLDLVFQQSVGDRSRASRLEWRVKRLNKKDKEKLVEGRIVLDQLLEEAN